MSRYTGCSRCYRLILACNLNFELFLSDIFKTRNDMPMTIKDCTRCHIPSKCGFGMTRLLGSNRRFTVTKRQLRNMDTQLGSDIYEYRFLDAFAGFGILNSSLATYSLMGQVVLTPLEGQAEGLYLLAVWLDCWVKGHLRFSCGSLANHTRFTLGSKTASITSQYHRRDNVPEATDNLSTTETSMNGLNLHQSSKAEADLKKVVEPLASYISATNRPRATLILALIMLVNNVQEIADAANTYLATLSENHLG